MLTGYCINCGTKFEYRQKKGRAPQHFCSPKCYGEYRMRENDKHREHWKKLYLEHGLSAQKIAQQEGVSKKLVSRYLRSLNISMRTPGYYRRKTITYKTGYKVIEAEGHPRAFDGRKFYEHILVAEKTLGRYFKRR